jgi:hypothetical protein
LERIARIAGDSDMVVSATPSENTVRFYLGRGFQPMADPLAELLKLEPGDVHMRKTLLSALRISARGDGGVHRQRIVSMHSVITEIG